MLITGVRTVTCDIPLSKPIVMGELRFDSREYCLVFVDTDQGVTGLGVGMTRNAPVAAIVERNLAPLLLGQDPLMTEAIWDRLYYRNLTIGGRGIFMRALSAVDIALWDIKGQAAGLPIWQLLGGARDRIPLAVAGGYVGEGKTNDDLAREMADYVGRGFSIVKISAGELEHDTERLRVSADVVAGRAALAYDAHWAWRGLYEVVPTVRSWTSLGLAFIEDPLAPELVARTPELRAATGIPLALGEDAVGRWAFQHLLTACRPDIVRVDATTVGGVSEAVKVCTLASIESRPVIPHVFPEVHVHLAAAFPVVLAVEMTVPEYEIDLLFRLFKEWVTIESGVIQAPRRPGLGVSLDDATVKRYQVASSSSTDTSAGVG
jgi:L-alanine-DL-glutamate epimerase-like enolase superfamily enzyme